MLWEFLTNEAKVLKKVTLRSQRETSLADVWQVDLDKFVVEPSQVKERCTTCQRIVTRRHRRRRPAPATTAMARPSPSSPIRRTTTCG